MKRDVSEFVTKCFVCQRVKAEHQVPLGLLQPIIILEWKWDRITMDFVVGLPLTGRKHDSVWVIVDRLTKSAHFLPVRTNYSIDKLAELYIKEIVQLHGCKTRENSNFRKKGKTVILVKTRNFYRSWMTKWISPLESSREIYPPCRISSHSEIVGISRFTRHRVSGAVKRV